MLKLCFLLRTPVRKNAPQGGVSYDQITWYTKSDSRFPILTESVLVGRMDGVCIMGKEI
jgi:hypothetical protein